ncbi:MAG: helix-turn-helix domain-containing protein [Pseudomonadota bacterium]
MDERLFLRLDGDPVHGPETRLPDDSMRAFEVAPALRGHVASIALYREHIPPGHEVIERVLPDGAVHLVFNLGDAPSANGAPGLALEAVGASSAPAVLRLRGRLEGLSLTLRPGAAAALLGLPAGEISHAAVPLDALWRGEAARLLEQMAAARDDGARAALLQAALQRRLQQLFHAHVGLSPRAYGRLARLHACLRALREQPDPAWPELALQAGFYDQSHLVNEFRSLCGLTPTLFLQRTVSGSSKTTG